MYTFSRWMRPAKKRLSSQQADGDRDHQPHAGDAVLVAESDAADGRGAAEHDGGHRAGVQRGAEAPAGDQEVGGVLGPGLAPEAEREHGGEIDDDDRDVDGLAHGEAPSVSWFQRWVGANMRRTIGQDDYGGPCAW